MVEQIPSGLCYFLASGFNGGPIEYNGANGGSFIVADDAFPIVLRDSPLTAVIVRSPKEEIFSTGQLEWTRVLPLLFSCPEETPTSCRLLKIFGEFRGAQLPPQPPLGLRKPH